MKLLSELLLTFSNQKSFFSSKRIERFAIFSTMLIATICYLAMAILKCDIGATDFVIIVTMWLGYAGFNTVRIKKDNTEDATDK